MPNGFNLKLRGSVYYARMKVPLELQHLMGVKELARSLNTKDRRTASMRKLSVLAEWHEQFESLRRRRHVSETDFANATWEHYAAELEADERERALPVSEGAPGLAMLRQHQLRALREHLGRGETVMVQWAADAFIERHQLILERGSNQYRELCFRLMRAQIEALLRGRRVRNPRMGRLV